MGTYIHGGRTEDYVWDTGTELRAAGVPISVFDAATLSPVTGLTDGTGAPITVVITDVLGRYHFTCDSGDVYLDVTDSTGVVRWGPVQSGSALSLAIQAIPGAVQAAADAADARADAETAAAAAIAAGKYSTVSVDDTLMPARGNLNFAGAVVVTDDAGGGTTTVTIPQADIRTARLAANANLGRPGLTLTNVPGLSIAFDPTVGNTTDVEIDIEVSVHYQAGSAANAKISLLLPSAATNILGQWDIRTTADVQDLAPITTATGVVDIKGAGASVRKVARFEGSMTLPPGIATPILQLQMAQGGTEAVDLIVFARSRIITGRSA